MITVAYFLGTHEDWGGASRAVLNFVRSVDREKIRPIVCLTKKGDLSATLTDQDIEWWCVKKQDFSVNVFAYARTVLRTVRLLRRSGVDIVHLNHGSVEWKPPAVIAAKLLSLSVVYHFHSQISSPSPSVKFADRVIVVSDFIGRNVNTLRRPMSIIHNIVDLPRFEGGANIRAKLGLAADAVVVSFIGQVKLIKGIDTFLRACSLVTDREVRFLIAGEFREESDELDRTSFDARVASDSRISYLGYQSNIQDIYRSSDVIVMPSIYEEPCAMVLFEAAAARKPTIATCTGGTPEIIKDGESGMLFDPDDATALAGCIQTLVADTELGLRLGQKAHTIAVETFSRSPVAQLESLYAELAKRK